MGVSGRFHFIRLSLGRVLIELAYRRSIIGISKYSLLKEIVDHFALHVYVGHLSRESSAVISVEKRTKQKSTTMKYRSPGRYFISIGQTSFSFSFTPAPAGRSVVGSRRINSIKRYKKEEDRHIRIVPRKNFRGRDAPPLVVRD